MLSEVLGLTIKKKVLNEDSSKKVVPAHKLLKKAALNYAELSKAANDLNIVRQNIVTLVGLYGVKSTNNEDMHLLKEDEVEKKFVVQQNKEIAARTTPAIDDSKSPKNVKFDAFKNNAKKLAIQAKDKAKKLFKSLMDNIKKFAKQLLDKVKDYAKNAWKYLKELSDKIVGDKIKELEKKEATKIAKQAAKKVGKAAAKIAARTAAVATGPLGWVVLIIWTLWDGLTDAWDKWQETGDWYETLKAGIAGLVDSLTFGLFDKETAAKVIDGTVNFLKDIPKNIGKFVTDTAKAIDDIVSGLVKKISEMNPLKPKPMTDADFAKVAEDAVRKAKEQDELKKKNEKLAEDLAKAQQLVAQKTQQRNALIDEIAALEVDAYGKKTEETEQVIKKKEELRKTEKALDDAVQKEGAMRKEAAAPKPAPPAPSKPSPAPEGMRGRAKQFAEAVTTLGIRNVYAIQALVATAAKESGLDPKSKETGAKGWLATLNNRGVSYVYNKFPQLGPGGRVAKLMNEPNGVSPEKLKEIWSKGDEAFFSMVYDGLTTNSKPGDGYLFRGRGFIQITGRSIYKNIGKIIGVDLENNPDSIMNDFDIASKAAAGYILNSVGQGNKEKGLAVLNKMPDFKTALKVIIGNVAMGGLGGDMAKVEAAFTTSKLAATNRGQLEAASKYENLALDSTSKEVSQGQREQMKPTDVNVVNVAQTNNTKVNDTKVAAVDKKTNGNDALLSRAT